MSKSGAYDTLYLPAVARSFGAGAQCGAGVQLYRNSKEWDLVSGSTDTSPAFAAGVAFTTGNLDLSLGMNAVLGDETDSVGLIAGVSIPVR